MTDACRSFIESRFLMARHIHTTEQVKGCARAKSTTRLLRNNVGQDEIATQRCQATDILHNLTKIKIQHVNKYNQNNVSRYKQSFAVKTNQ